MKALNFPITAKGKNLKQLLLLAVAIVVFGVAGYFIVTNWRSLPEVLPKLPAGMFVFTEENKESVDEKIVNEEFFPLELGKLEVEKEKYVEKAEKGEGLTHLARRALEKHLQENPQDFEVTAEHKIYMEDYIAKKIGTGWLELGQEVEISVELIKEAIEKSTELSPEQLDNLTQYSQLVSF